MGIFKWIGGFLGWMVAGPLGMFAGYFIGSLFDSDDEKSSIGSGEGYTGSSYATGNGSQHSNSNYDSGQRNSFLFSMLVLASYIIKADGKVMHSEMEYVRSFLRQNFGADAEVQGDQILKRLFQEQDRMTAQDPDSFRRQIQDVCRQMKQHMDISMRLQMLHFLTLIAKADGNVHPSELNALYELARYLGLTRSDVDSMLHMNSNNQGGYRQGGGSSSSTANEMTLDDAYKILGVNPTATDDEVKTAYRKMALKHHPDRVATLGDDVRKASERKFKEIGQAKDKIYAARGL